jgi:hypothetical protein
MLLEAVVPTYAKVPLPFTRAAQHALDELQASCVADASCAKAFPNFSSEWTEVNRRFAGGPQRVTFQDAHGMTTAMLSREVFADSVRHVLYSQFFAAALSAAIHAAARNDYGPLAMLIATQIDETKTVLAFGMFFSVTCSEDVVFITPQETEAAKSLGFLGDLRIRGQQRMRDLEREERVKEVPLPRTFQRARADDFGRRRSGGARLARRKPASIPQRCAPGSLSSTAGTVTETRVSHACGSRSFRTPIPGEFAHRAPPSIGALPS